MQPFDQSPVSRPFAESRLLSGFLSEEQAEALSAFRRAPEAVRAEARSKFGIALSRPTVPSERVSFRPVEEPTALGLLQAFGLECGGVPSLANLVGFEWVSIRGLVAGHLLTEAMAKPQKDIKAEASIDDVARYSLFGPPLQLQEDLVQIGPLVLLSPSALRFVPEHMQFDARGVSVRYAMRPHPSPIRVLLLDNRAIATRHLERLVALHEAGHREALCVVHYGYGVDTISHMPSAPILAADSAPPRIADFSDATIMTRIPIRTPAVMIRACIDVIDVGVTD